MIEGLPPMLDIECGIPSKQSLKPMQGADTMRSPKAVPVL
jgi:hypothetical protein